MHLITRATLFLAISAMATFAADVAGKWKASFQTPNGARESTLNLKVDGGKLTGAMESTRGSSEIQDGKVDGNNLSFSIVRKFNDNEFKIEYKGVVSGDEMKLTMNFNGNEIETTAKREK